MAAAMAIFRPFWEPEAVRAATGATGATGTTGTTGPTVGGGAPDGQISAAFSIAFYRNNFNLLVSLPPVNNVHTLGTQGLVQEFNDANSTGAKLALVMPDKSTEAGVVQMLSGVYTYYTSVGVNAAGYPTSDTMSCPQYSQTCTYNLFTNNYGLFVFTSGNPNGTNFSVSSNIYTKWTGLGGLTGLLGIVWTDQAAVTSSTAVTANGQTFTGGAIYSLTSGTYSGSTFAVIGAVNTVYNQYGGPTGALGLPISDDIAQPGGTHYQQFEGGKITYSGSATPVVAFPVTQINLTPAGPVTLQYGQTLSLSTLEFDTQSNIVTGRVITWISSNGQVATVTSSGNTAVVHAVGGGNATITAISEGKLSNALAVTVIEPCCQVGQGAPTAAISQAFQDAVSRNHLSVQAPGPNAVQRMSTGYVQDLISSDGSSHYLVTKADGSGTAYVVTGAMLTAYNLAGGPSGLLGFPTSDIGSGGTQLFTNGALAGFPIQQVTGTILTKWAALKYEAGAAGVPTAAQQAFTSQSAYTGFTQAFANGMIAGITNSNRAGQAYFVSGAILTLYQSVGGPAGELGIPVGDAVAANGVTQQNFENGTITYAAGSAAQEHLSPRTPAISANPPSALAGSRLRLAVTGFNNGATLRVSVTGQQDFLVTTANGSYEWDVNIPASAASATVKVHAVDTATGATADGTYTVKSLADAHPQLTKVQGDNQTGSPGTALAQTLIVALKDNAGNAIPNAAVTFTASPGGVATPASAMTDANGRASTVFRLPASSGIAAVTARAAGQIAIFDANALGTTSLSNFPKFNQTSVAGTLGQGSGTIAQKGSLLAAAAAIIRYYQNQGALGSANGLADPATLNTYLTHLCLGSLCDGFVTNPDSGEQVVNLWRLTNFAVSGLDVSIEATDLTSIRGLVASGYPVLLSLALSQDGAAAGGAAVVATGIATDGSLQISDPNSVSGRTSLNDYTTGFSAAGHTWTGTVVSAARLIPRTPSATGFAIEAISQLAAALPAISVQSAGGVCSSAFVVQDAAVLGGTPANPVRASEFVYCDGSQPVYQIGISSSQAFRANVTDLASGGGSLDASGTSAVNYQAARTNGLLTLSTPAVSFTTAAVLNAASYTGGLAPGEIVSIFGSGLAGAGATTQVTVGGQSAQVLLASAFQVNAQVPASLAPGNYALAVQSAFGIATQNVTLAAAAPGIFVLSNNSDGTITGAVVNQSGAINSATAPANRGETIVIYATGLGATAAQGSLSVTTSTVQAVLGGTTLPVSFAGLTPGFVGLYQVNVPIPATTAPGLALSLSLVEAGAGSNTVSLALN